MKKNIFYILSTILLTYSVDTKAQVGVGTNNPAGALDLNPTIPTNHGFIPPRVALTDAVTAAPVTNPQGGALANGTLVYNTFSSAFSANQVLPGLYFWNGLRWITFAGSPGGLDWTLTGNAFTTSGTFAAPGVTYLGTSDATAVHISTGGIPRIRIDGTTGNVGIGQNTAPNTRLAITAIPAATDSALDVTGQGSSSSFLISAGSIANTATDYATALTINTASVPTAINPNIALRAASGVATYITPIVKQNIAITSNATDLALYCATEGIVATKRRAAEFRTNDAGISSDNDANDPLAYLAGYADAMNVDGLNTRDVKYGGYMYGGNAGSYAYVGARLNFNIAGSRNYKIIGPGTVSTIVAGDKPNDSKKIMFAPEAPEVLFEDFGNSNLVNGVATITIDPIFAKNIYVDDKKPLKVFIQDEGGICKGVFVTNKTKNSFTVKELKGGKSNAKFSWHIVANRADEIDKDGVKSSYQDARFPDAPEGITPEKVESKAIASTNPEIKK